jgi:hypothetical protein
VLRNGYGVLHKETPYILTRLQWVWSEVRVRVRRKRDLSPNLAHACDSIVRIDQPATTSKLPKKAVELYLESWPVRLVTWIPIHREVALPENYYHGHTKIPGNEEADALAKP